MIFPVASRHALIAIQISENENAEQGVPGYGPQAVAMRSLSHATIVYCIARGPSPEP